MTQKPYIIGMVLLVIVLTACSSEQQQDTAKREDTHQHETMQGQTAEADMVVDPVCGMKIKKADATNTYEWEGETYYFCMEADYNAFVADPKKYVAAIKN